MENTPRILSIVAVIAVAIVLTMLILAAFFVGRLTDPAKPLQGEVRLESWPARMTVVIETTRPHANAFPPASAATMFAAWATCSDSSYCTHTFDIRGAETVRFESGDTVTLPATTGEVYPVFAYQNATGPLNTSDTTYRPTSITLTSDTNTELVGDFGPFPGNGITGPFTGWTTRVAYLVGPAVTDPAATDYVVAQ